MKFVIILLLTTGGLEQIKYPIESGLTCEGQAHKWRDANVTYYDTRNTDQRPQGWYTKEGNLWIGHICES